MGDAMFRVELTTTVKSVADMPVAMQLAAEVTGCVNRQHSLKMNFGAEVFNECRIHWYFDFESVDKLSAMGMTLLQDAKYTEMLTKGKGLWVEGSLRDTIVKLAG
jgi:hypothetical protein